MDKETVEFAWVLLSEYINDRDKQTAADHFVADLIDAGLDEEALIEMNGIDKYLKNAVQDHIGELYDDEEIESEW